MKSKYPTALPEDIYSIKLPAANFQLASWLLNSVTIYGYYLDNDGY
jgi:hypothetical protein